MIGCPFSFVENEVNRRYTKLEPISRRTLLKDMQTVRVEKNIAKEPPKIFGLFIDRLVRYGYLCGLSKRFSTSGILSSSK